MRVQVVDAIRGEGGVIESYRPVSQISGFGVEATLREYTNKKSNLPDPIIEYAPGRWVHFSTVKHAGREVQNLDTGEIIKIKNLSPCCVGHERLGFIWNIVEASAAQST